MSLLTTGTGWGITEQVKKKGPLHITSITMEMNSSIPLTSSRPFDIWKYLYDNIA